MRLVIARGQCRRSIRSLLLLLLLLARVLFASGPSAPGAVSSHSPQVNESLNNQ